MATIVSSLWRTGWGLVREVTYPKTLSLSVGFQPQVQG